MKNSNQNKLKRLMSVTLLVIFIFLSGCQKETIEVENETLNLEYERIGEIDNLIIDDEEDVIITNDLSILLVNTNTDKNTDNTNKGCPEITSGEGFPLNGCKDFTVGFSVAGWVYIETEVTICCACAVCGMYSGNQQKQNKDIANFKIITIETSSSMIFNNYEISIAGGDYAVNESGEIMDLHYKVITRK